jgi:sugar phosphate permease
MTYQHTVAPGSRPPRLHYAWAIAGVTFFTLLIGAGIRSSPGVLVVPLENEFHWSRATISFAVGVNICLYGLIAPFAAATMDRFGVRRTLLVAISLIFVGVAITPLMTESWQLVLLWGVVVGSGTGFVANVLAALIASRWFSARRGLVLGLLTSAAAAGQLLFLPLFASIAAAFGWRAMALTVAGAALLLLPGIAFVMRDRPEDIGLAPYGEEPGAPVARPPAGNPVRAAFAALGVGIRSRDFWLLAGSFFICGASTNGLIGTHLIPACIDHGIAEVAAAGVLASMAVFNFIGTTGAGWLSDRVDNRVLLSVFYGLRGLSLVYLPFAFDSFYSLGLFTAFYGLDWLATVPATVRLAGKSFGKERAAVMYGWITASHQLGGACAAFLAGVLRVDLGSYMQAFIISGLLCFLASVMVLFIGTGRKLPQADAPANALPQR